MDHTWGRLPNVYKNEPYSFGFRIYTAQYESSFKIGTVRTYRSDSAIGWSLKTHLFTVPSVPWHVAYKWRKLGGLRFYRAQYRILRKVFK